MSRPAIDAPAFDMNDLALALAYRATTRASRRASTKLDQMRGRAASEQLTSTVSTDCCERRRQELGMELLARFVGAGWELEVADQISNLIVRVAFDPQGAGVRQASPETPLIDLPADRPPASGPSPSLL
jgi:hypothetical protein